MLQEQDYAQLKSLGISEERFRQQLVNFTTGFPYLEIEAAANVTNGGILRVPLELHDRYITLWEDYLAEGSREVAKFVPASGAASRMFKDLFAFLDADSNQSPSEAVQHFFEQLPTAAFASALDEAAKAQFGQSTADLIAAGRFKDVVRCLLSAEGLNYGQLPKGLLAFHRTAEGVRTPFEEHLVEASLYAKDDRARSRVHFTISPEHRPLFEALATAVLPAYESQLHTTFELEFSEQLRSTDTVAANADNSPFRSADGKLLFRPGGHGALLENLNTLDVDIVFLKNIDNVVPDRLKTPMVAYKKMLAGVLVAAQRQIFSYLEQLDEGNVDEEQLSNMLYFLENQLHCTNEAARALEGLELMDYLYCKFNRPLRVCGMVRNVGEPGGGPFFAYNADGSCSLQILESSQIDMADETKKRMFEGGTHFNPVDLVCAVRNYEGDKFDLRDYVDPATGFISQKSKDGRTLKALELPGLWNGAMSDWNTIFVEVPLSTFNPVKTVNDLFREEHQ